MNHCLNCNSETSNPKFCGKSCAASYNNKTYPKRKPEGACVNCGNPVSSSLKRCKNCLVIDNSLNSNSGSNPYIRAQARKLYIKEGRSLKCALCSYSIHVDICHIKDVRSYPIGTLYSVINSQSNLIALCKNHHWEFDHDVL